MLFDEEFLIPKGSTDNSRLKISRQMLNLHERSVEGPAIESLDLSISKYFVTLPSACESQIEWHSL